MKYIHRLGGPCCLTPEQIKKQQELLDKQKQNGNNQNNTNVYPNSRYVIATFSGQYVYPIAESNSVSINSNINKVWYKTVNSAPVYSSLVEEDPKTDNSWTEYSNLVAPNYGGQAIGEEGKTTIVMYELIDPTSLENYMFYNNSTILISIPSSVTSIGEYTLGGVGSYIIFNSLTPIENVSISGTSPLRIAVNESVVNTYKQALTGYSGNIISIEEMFASSSPFDIPTNFE